jgi:hypothetical protein
MMRTDDARFDAPVAVDARPCAVMHGYGWQQAKQGFILASTGTNSARRLPGAPT